MKTMATEKLIVKQTRSTNRHPKKHLATLRALGLGRIGKVAEHQGTPSVIGMIKSVCHLVQIERVK